MSMLAPGTYVQETNFPTFNTSSPTQGSFVFVGAHNRGPTTQTLVRSWSQFVSIFGGFTGTAVPSMLALAVYSFFNNGGGSCYIIRVAHSDAVSAANVLNATGPVATLTASAANPGVWGNSINVVTTLSGSNRFNLAVYYGGTATSQLAEPVWTGLSMNPGDSRYAPSIINNPLNGSSFIRLTDMAANPLVTPGPLPLAATTVLGTGSGSTAGVDGSTVTSSDLIATQAQLNQIRSPLVINFPGITDVTNVINPMIAYCQTGRSAFADSIVIVDPPSAQSVAAAVTYAGTLTTSSYAALYYPWVTISDPASASAGALRTLPPGAFAMAAISNTDAVRGVQKAPAGFNTTLNALAPEAYLQNSDIATLTQANVNCIKYLPGSGVVVWGARTLSNVQQTLYLNVRRTLIYIEAQVQQLAQYGVFEDNDHYLWNQLTRRITTFLTAFWGSGGLAGTTAAQAFFVVCDSSNNNPASGTVNVQVGVAPASPAEFIIISVGQYNGGTTVTESSTQALGL